MSTSSCAEPVDDWPFYGGKNERSNPLYKWSEFNKLGVI